MSFTRRIGKRLLAGAVGGGTGLVFLKTAIAKDANNIDYQRCIKEYRYEKPKERSEHINSLKTTKFDVVIIGGGATGAGCALDAVSRGLKVAIIERDDFASGTSSRSTKLIHGGVRYLEKAFLQLDFGQFSLVREALHERKTLLDIAPHLCRPLPIMLPVYSYIKLPYFWAGSKFYDLVAGSSGLTGSYFLSLDKVKEIFPLVKANSLVGGIVYYDGQMEDCRMNLSVALTAAKMGATVLNYTEVTELVKDDNDKIKGVKVLDAINNEMITVEGKTVVNATGPYTDGIRSKDDANSKTLVKPSSGAHVVLPGYFCNKLMGMLDPSTGDGRVLFFLPWQGHTLVGTTDQSTELERLPKPTEDEIDFIIQECKNQLTDQIEISRKHVLSAWSGIRPLVMNPNSSGTENVVRSHFLQVSDSGLITMAGGKWTTYRSMAEETIDKAVEVGNLETNKNSIKTSSIKLVGATGWNESFYVKLIEDYGFTEVVAQHLSNIYGLDALEIANKSNQLGLDVNKKIHPDMFYVQAEIDHAIDEFAVRAIDVLARRTRMAFLNSTATEESIPIVVSHMAKRLGWSPQRIAQETEIAKEFLSTMGCPNK